MTSLACSIYRSMIRISKKNDPRLVDILKNGLSTFNDSPLPDFYNFKYIHNNKVFFVYGPYENETANMLSYTKCLIRSGKNTDYTMDRLFLAHRELPNFFIAKEKLENRGNKQINMAKIKNVNQTSFGTSFF